MRKNIVLSVCLLFVASFPATSVGATAELKDCRLKRYASLDLAEDPSQGLVVPVSIQGAEAHMVLEADDWISSVTERDAHRLSLHVQPLPWSTDVRSKNNKPLQRMAIAKHFALGNITMTGANFVVVPDNTVGTNVIGSLGMNIFAHFDIEIDMVNRQLNLYSPDHCPGNVVYWSKTYDSVPIEVGELGELYFPMELDGKKIETTLATDIAVTTLSTDVTRRLFDFDANSSDVETATDADGRIAARYRAMQLSAEGINVFNAKIELVKPPADFCGRIISRLGAMGYEGCNGVHPLRLGLNVLKKLHVYIATKEKVLYFTPAVVAN